jgi:YVTN family beta-propeller protein
VVSPDGSSVWVANTTSNTVSLILTPSNAVSANIPVGIDPVGLAMRPDGLELWVANHISDSISVIDTDSTSASYLRVIETIQDVDGNGVTQFDEPVGIAFASNSKAYVSLSSRNDIAVIDATNYSVTGRIHITAQDPRAIAVQGGLLFVAAFESGNQSELSLCPTGGSAPQCTLGAQELQDFVLESPNIPGSDARIVIDPDVPDRDLFVIDTTTDQVVGVIEGVGTLLYGVTADSNGTVWISQVDARNEVNGGQNVGSEAGNQDLFALENRLFLNQLAEVDCSGGNCSCGGGLNPVCTPGAAPRTVHELEPLPPSHPAAGDQLATPYGISLTSDDATLVVTAAASSRIFTASTASGAVLSRFDVGAIPRGVALLDNGDGTHTAYVLNTLGNSVSVVTVTDATGALASAGADIPVGDDPTDPNVLAGRIAFNTAEASTTGTFSCASCHPDGMNDQLLWRIGGPCFFGQCEGVDEIRSTMPVRGLKNTLPLHWDGTLGDPFDNTDNGAFGGGDPQPSNCNGADDSTCFRQLVDASQSGVMCEQPGCAVGPSGLAGLLTTQERNDMGAFLAAVRYPPARSRPADDDVSAGAELGFSDFFVDQQVGFPNDLGDLAGVVTCADMDSGCHALPLGVDHSSVTLAGFDVPTMRGMTDRFLQFSIGITAPEEALVDATNGDLCADIGFGPICVAADVPWDPEQGFEEDGVFSAAFAIFQPVYGDVLATANAVDMFQMFEEASTGYTGAMGRQVTLNTVTAAGCPACDAEDRLIELEAADTRGAINLRGRGLRSGAHRTISYINPTQPAPNDIYRVGAAQLTRADLIAEAQAGTLLATLTGNLRSGADTNTLQPLLSVTNLGDGNGTNPDIPLLPGDNPMTLAAIDVDAGATVLVDGAVVTVNTFSCASSFPCTDDLTIELAVVPGNGLHLLQVQNASGLQSNELPICVGSIAACD